MDDPEGDDYGPGTYTYPTNAVFEPGVFDLTAFEVYETENDVIFHVQFKGPIDNVWGSPIGLSVQTIDIYIDTDGIAGSGSTEALAGRRVRIADDSAWEYADLGRGMEPDAVQRRRHGAAGQGAGGDRSDSPPGHDSSAEGGHRRSRRRNGATSSSLWGRRASRRPTRCGCGK